MSRLNWAKLLFLRYYRNMGLRVVLYVLLSLSAIALSPVVGPLFGDAFGIEMDFSSVLPVLTILASSMLAVSTFSLNIMVSVHRAAAAQATPRVHRILLEDTTTQSVLSAFIGAFVYSLGSIVFYHLGLYPEDAAIVVMGITTLVVVIVVISLLRWIEHLTDLGSVEDSLRLSRTRASDTLVACARMPRFGASALTPDTVLPSRTTPLCAPCSGVVQLVNMAQLHDALPDTMSAYLSVRPGQHVLEGQVLADLSGDAGDEVLRAACRAFTIGEHRTHEQDAEFGLLVLSEIASKALSPGINDPGTAIEVLHIQKSLLWNYGNTRKDDAPPTAPRIFAAFPDPGDLIEAAFAAVARDGADTIEVALTLRRTLAALAGSDNDDLANAARAFARTALCHAEEAGLPERSLDRLRGVKGL